jgi:hypothetical protein
MAIFAGAMACEPAEDLMIDVIGRLAVAMNAHDLDGVAGSIHKDYRQRVAGAPGQGPRRTSPDARQLGGHFRGDPGLPRRHLPVRPGW